MDVTDAILSKSVSQRPFGTFEPFVTGDDDAVAAFYARVLAGLERTRNVAVIREHDHHGSGYASYVSAFLYPRDGSTRIEARTHVTTTGVLLYLSRLAPIAVFGRSDRTDHTTGGGGASGFIEATNLNLLPDGDWSDFMYAVRSVLTAANVELMAREPLMLPAPAGLRIPTAFNPPYYVFDALFYWED
jgi:hypothetical protein